MKLNHYREEHRYGLLQKRGKQRYVLHRDCSSLRVECCFPFHHCLTGRYPLAPSMKPSRCREWHTCDNNLQKGQRQYGLFRDYRLVWVLSCWLCDRYPIVRTLPHPSRRPSRCSVSHKYVHLPRRLIVLEYQDTNALEKSCMSRPHQNHVLIMLQYGWSQGCS